MALMEYALDQNYRVVDHPYLVVLFMYGIYTMTIIFKNGDHYFLTCINDPIGLTKPTHKCMYYVVLLDLALPRNILEYINYVIVY